MSAERSVRVEQFPTITLRKGATSVVEVDLSGFDMQGGTVVLAIADKKGRVLWSWEADESRVHYVTVPDEFTAGLKLGESRYVYDIMWHLNDERFAQCAPSPVIVEATAGGYPYDPS